MDELDSIYWHDGFLDDVRFSVMESGGEIILQVRVYDSHEAQFGIGAPAGQKAATRKRLTVHFRNVASCQFTCDVNELLDNRSAAEIANGYVKTLSQPDGSGFFTYRMYLCDGYMEITARSADVSERL